MSLAYTPLDDLTKTHAALAAHFKTGVSKPVDKRRDQLVQLLYMVKDNLDRWKDALAKDLGRPALEAEFLELTPVITEVLEALKSVGKWAATEKAPFSLNFFAMKPVIRKEPKGVVLIIAPFNYPVFLTLGPLIGAIAAGCAAVVKPSEMTPHTSSLLAELFPKYLDPELYALVNGTIPETTRLLELPWDHILYTGNGRVARIVAKAAAEHLTPISLELGGKSPVFVDPGCDLNVAARRILWGKMANAGQTCVAPDYVLVPEAFQDEFVQALKNVHQEFYQGNPAKSDSYSRIINDAHFGRLTGMLDGTKGEVVFGGESDAGTRYIAPTVVRNVPTTDSLMSDEIFGPLLPIVPVKDLDEAIKFVTSGDHPLALYVFTKDAKYKARVFDSTQSGSAIANEVLIQIGVDGLPFGGIGPSGSGAHTGKYSFNMFTYLRPSIDSPSFVDIALRGRFPPYTDKNRAFLAKMVLPARFPARDKYRAGKASVMGVGRLWRWAMFSLALAVIGAWARRGGRLRI